MKDLREFLFVKHRHNWGLLFRFGLVGGSGVVVNIAVFYVLLQTVGVPQAVFIDLPGTELNVRMYHVFSTIAFFIANISNFQLNRVYTFGSAGRAPWWGEYKLFLAIGLAAQALALLILTAFLHPDSILTLPADVFDGSNILRQRELAAQLLTIAIVTPVSFVGNKLWTFKSVRSIGHGRGSQ